MDFYLVATIVALLLAVVGIYFAWPGFRRDSDTTASERFRSDRLSIARNRPAHTKAAGMLFDDHQRLEGADYVTHPTWRLDRPVPIERVKVAFRTDRKVPTVHGTSKTAQRLLPARSTTGATYADAVGSDPDLRPSLWWNASSFDLLSFQASDDGINIECSVTGYFEMFDVCESVAHEFVAAVKPGQQPSARHLRLRHEIDDVFDMSRRPFVPAIPTLVLLRPQSGPATFLLHARDETAVASAAGLRHLFGGQFQPSTQHAVEPGRDADLWLSVARELAEEMLGFDEHDGTASAPLTFDREPLRSLQQLRESGSLGLWILGMGIDPLTLWPDILTVAVIDAEPFEKQFPKLPFFNSEGRIVGSAESGGSLLGFEFTEAGVESLAASVNTHPGAAACLRLAWRHRATILPVDHDPIAG